jgi:hypothetical protein
MKTNENAALVAVPPPATGSVTLAEGRYENGKGAWLEVMDVQMPGYPKYDGGMTGVSIKWGRQRQFVIARDVAHFWSQWPYSLCAPSQNNQAEP